METAEGANPAPDHNRERQLYGSMIEWDGRAGQLGGAGVLEKWRVELLNEERSYSTDRRNQGARHSRSRPT
jgi:hypothetical protein